MSNKKTKVEAKEVEVDSKTVDTPKKEDNFMERAAEAQKEIVPILEKYEIAIVGQLNEFNSAGITAKAVFADNKKYE